MARTPAQEKWDAANMAYQTIKLKRALLDEFKAACAAQGDKVNTVLVGCVQKYVDAFSGKTEGASMKTVTTEAIAFDGKLELTKDETLLLIAQLKADVDELQDISKTETVDDETRQRAAKNASLIMALVSKMAGVEKMLGKT